jgi:hypothetical protein
VTRMNISVPDALAEDARRLGVPVSAVCQRALREEVSRREPGPPAGYAIAKTLRVVREGSGHARLYIDGEYFEYATVDGFTVHPKRNEIPGVTVTIAAWRVELVDDIDAKPGELSPGANDAEAGQ